MENDENKYIIDESQEISLGEQEGWVKKIFSAFPAFKHRNYKLYFTGQFISLVGTWLQMVAQAWLVLQLTHSAFLIGLVSALGSIPILIFSLFGGVIVDRFSKKKIIMVTQFLQMILAFILGLLTILGIINIYEIFVLAFALGVVIAIDMPARQAFAVEMVGKEDLSSAIALNSGIFNSARIIGPALAGIAIAVFGTGGAFIFNGASYIAAIIALFFIKVQTVSPRFNPRPIEAIKEGIKYSFSNVIIKNLLIFTAITSIFGWSYSTVMPLIVSDVFERGADTLGYFNSTSGIGALLGVILVSSLSKKINNFMFIMGGNLLFALSVLIFSLTSNIYLAFFLLFFSGAGIIMQFSMVNTTIQHAVGDHIRGRIMSIYTVMFIGMTPLGSLQIGIIAEHFGPQFAIRLGAIILLIFSVILFFNRQKLKLPT
ncbi:MAG: MFS transporter [Candidatus Levyibacteriota bacterium]